MSNNTYELVWGNDREITTYDNAGGCYLGPIKQYKRGGLNLTATGTARATECIGGGLLVLNGTVRMQAWSLSCVQRIAERKPGCFIVSYGVPRVGVRFVASSRSILKILALATMQGSLQTLSLSSTGPSTPW